MDVDTNMDEDPEAPEDSAAPEDLVALVSKNKKKRWDELTPGGLRSRCHRIRKKLRAQTTLNISEGVVDEFLDLQNFDVPLLGVPSDSEEELEEVIRDPVCKNISIHEHFDEPLADALPNSSFTPNRDPVVTDYVRNQLNEIVTKHSLVRAPVDSILKLLRTFFPNLPSDARTLRSTPKSVKTRNVDPGIYIHQGVETFMRLLIHQLPHVEN